MTNIALDWCKYIKMYYDMGLYTNDDVKTFVPLHITADEYKAITGEDYVA